MTDSHHRKEEQLALFPSCSIAQLAVEWDCHPMTITRLIERGELMAFRLGRVIRVCRSSAEKYAQLNLVAPKSDD